MAYPRVSQEEPLGRKVCRRSQDGKVSPWARESHSGTSRGLLERPGGRNSGRGEVKQQEHLNLFNRQHLQACLGGQDQARPLPLRGF